MAFPRIIGTCVFRNEGNGCLTSKYINNRSEPLTESCKLMESTAPGDRFIGRYATCWIDSVSGETVNARAGILTIANGDRQGSFVLAWRPNEGEAYQGLGMLFEDLLVATYWSMPR